MVVRLVSPLMLVYLVGWIRGKVLGGSNDLPLVKNKNAASLGMFGGTSINQSSPSL